MTELQNFSEKLKEVETSLDHHLPVFIETWEKYSNYIELLALQDSKKAEKEKSLKDFLESFWKFSSSEIKVFKKFLEYKEGFKGKD